MPDPTPSARIAERIAAEIATADKCKALFAAMVETSPPTIEAMLETATLRELCDLSAHVRDSYPRSLRALEVATAAMKTEREEFRRMMELGGTCVTIGSKGIDRIDAALSAMAAHLEEGK